MSCKVYLGDCRDVIKDLQKESVDLVVTSPPYWSLRDYKTEPVIFDGQPDCRHKWGIETIAGDFRFRGNHSAVGNHANPEIWNGNGKGYFCSLCGAWKGQLGQEPTPELFIKHLLDVFDVVKPILKSTGSVFINLADTYSNSGSNSQPTHTSFGKLTQSGYKTTGHRANGLPPKCLCLIPERFAWGMIEHGWVLRNKIVWYKSNHMPESVKDRLTKSYEFIYHFVKQKKYYYNLDGIREPHKESSKERVLRAVSNSHKYIGSPYGGGGGINKPRPNRRTKIPSDSAGIFGTGARYHREHNSSISQYQYAEGDYLVVNLHPKGKNPGDVWNIPEKQSEKAKPHKTKFNDPNLNATSLTKSRDKYRKKGVPEGHPLGKNPGDVWQIHSKFMNPDQEPASPAARAIKSIREGKLPAFVRAKLKDTGLHLKNKLKESGFTVAEIADILGIKETTLAHYFRTDLSGQAIPDRNTWELLQDMIGIGSYDDYVSEEIRRALPILHPEGRNPSDLWSITTKSFRGVHYAVFPEDIPKKCINVACPKNGVVLDPFAGSGTTLKAAKELGRDAIGIELNPDYVRIIQERLNHDCEVIEPAKSRLSPVRRLPNPLFNKSSVFLKAVA